MQWGIGTIAAKQSTVQITLPKAYSNRLYKVSVTHLTGQTYTDTGHINSVVRDTDTYFQLVGAKGLSVAMSADWHTMGY